MLISSVQNPRVKQAVRLRERRPREKLGLTLIDGAREISRALEVGCGVKELFVCEVLCNTPDARQLLDRLSEYPGLEVFSVTPEVFAKIAYGERAEGVLAIVQTPQRRLNELQLSEKAVVAVVEGIEKPGNLGAVLRSADGAGIGAVLVANGRTDLYNPNVIRASLGTIFTVPICECESREALHWLRERGGEIFAARVDGSINYTEANLHGPAAIVLGSEAHGLSEIWNGPDITPIRLPMLGIADSLNISATAAVLFYEALRQNERR